MKKNQTPLLLLLLVIVGAGLIAVGFWWGKKTAPQPIAPQPSPSITQQIVPTITQAPVTNNPLAGTSWKLVVMMIEGVGQQPPTGSMVTLKFDASELSGNNSCNSYFGSYTVNGESIKIGQMGSTMMACANSDEFETNYMKTLGEASNFRLHSGNKLTIYSGTTGKTALDYEKTN